jgi:hypothetical protein
MLNVLLMAVCFLRGECIGIVNKTKNCEKARSYFGTDAVGMMVVRQLLNNYEGKSKSATLLTMARKKSSFSVMKKTAFI